MSMSMGRDTKWLTLEVCREFQRGTCSRSDAECKFAHPARSCHVENGRVIACFDSLKVNAPPRRTTRRTPRHNAARQPDNTVFNFFGLCLHTNWQCMDYAT